jgi:ribosome-binding protein aMBF1 (putative translation factor)
MKTNREKFLSLVTEEDENTASRNDWRIANQDWLSVSQQIAFNVLEKLDELMWTQKDLADKMQVSPQYVSKLVRGKENFTLETLVKLVQVLGIEILIKQPFQQITPPTQQITKVAC